MTTPAEITLTDVLDLTEARPLADALLGVRGQAVALDASGVERLGALCLQVLIAARRTWAADGSPFAIIRPSAAFSEQCARLGAAELCR